MNVVITGGLGVLGLACAHAFLKTGAQVVLADIKENIDLLQPLFLEHEPRLKFIQCDVKCHEDCSRLVHLSESFFKGAIQVYLVNAGAPFAGEFLRATQEQIQNILDVNVLGSIFCAQTAIPSLLQNPRSHLIFTCSLQSTMARANRSIYTTSKHAIAGLVKSLSLEFARNGLRVNGIAPAAIETPFLFSAFEATQITKEEGLKIAAESLPLGRLPTAQEFAQTALFLTSSGASSITGQLISLDAGASAGVFPRQAL
jgi:NAD(P)-dependent dehydrogenase (short-subunit alcohol dehydrogenase family)